MSAHRELFRFCACCPCPCRSAIPAEHAAQTQTVTPTALALLALAVIDGHLALDVGTRATLRQTAAAALCVPACPYGHDVAAALTEFVSARDACHDAKA